MQVKNHLLILVIVILVTVYTPPKAHGDGFAAENLPPATVGNTKITLFVKMNPPIITSNTTQEKYLQFRVFDANTNNTLLHDTLLITVTKASNEQQVLLRELFHTHTGVLTLGISTTTSSKWTIDGYQNFVLGWTSPNNSTIPVIAPMLGEGGLYHIHITLLSYLNDKNLFRGQDAPFFDAYLSVGDVSNHTISFHGNSYNSKIISYYDKLNDDFRFDPAKLQISFSMPFDWDPLRLQISPTFVHEEVQIPKAFKEFSSAPIFTASINGIPITNSKVVSDPYSIGDMEIVHLLINKDEIENIAKSIPPQSSIMNFTIAPVTSITTSTSDNLDNTPIKNDNVTVPEFSSIVEIVLVIAIISSITLSSYSRVASVTQN
jgi:hypothetical protein